MTRRFDRRAGDACYLTLVGPTKGTALEAAEAVFTGLAAARARGMSPFVEQIYGPASEREAILEKRQAVLRASGLDVATPCSFADGGAGEARGPVSVRVWGYNTGKSRSSELTTIEVPGAGVGRILEAPGVRLLWLPGIDGADQQGRFATSPATQAERMFGNAEGALLNAGFSYLDVVRTWIYSRRLVDWYDDLNRVRSAFHRDCGITGPAGAHPFPASTGIQGVRGGEECSMDLLAMQGDEGRASVRPLLASARQSPASSYGSGFSRGMLVEWAGAQTVLVSGTTSIGREGESLYADDSEAQLVQTLLSIGALLETCGAGLGDICSGAVYARDVPALRAYVSVARYLGFSELPLVPVIAQICRPELAVEIEAVATVPKPASGGAKR